MSSDAPAPVTPDSVAAAVLAVPGVARLHAGTFGEVASYLPGRRVEGVRHRADGVHVHVILRAGAPIRVTADAVRRAVAAVVAVADGGGRPVHVTVEDLEE